MMHRLVSFFWPQLSAEYKRKFFLLASVFFFVTGSYWVLRLLRDTIFIKIAFPVHFGWALRQGIIFLPKVKTLSPLIVLIAVLIYSKLADSFRRYQLFYVVGTFYILLFSLITVLLAIRSYWGDAVLGVKALATLGWVSFVSIESFGSLLITLFWSFVVSISTQQEAKVGFPFIVAGGQLGAIIGSLTNIFAKQIGGIWQLFLVGTLFIVMVLVLIHYFMRTIPASLLQGNQIAFEKDKERKQTTDRSGLWEGLRLLLTRPYLMGIFVISTFCDIAVTIVEYQMQDQADIITRLSGELGHSQFQGIFGALTNTVSLFLALFGATYLFRKWGIRFCLLVYPLGFGAALIGLLLLYFLGVTGAALLWVTAGVVMVVKGFSYAVNNPIKEMVYIPTSRDVKFKTKGWIDMFGLRMAKMGGSQITDFMRHNFPLLLVSGSILSLGIIGVWATIALYVGRTNHRLINEKKIIS